jgi:molecular chaperone GrpE
LNKENNKNETEEVESAELEEVKEPFEVETSQELEKIKKQLEEEKDRCLRLHAEFDNLRKRTLKEKEEFIKYANEKLILELIDVMEALERGLENAKISENQDKLIEGVELIYKQFKTILEKNGLIPIKAVGEKFDHNKHEAMMQTPTDEYEENTVLEEFSRGYMLNNKVIRYSKVRVSKKIESEVDEVI